jgi:ADP-heptose:LPS heptosyltransferase
MGFGDEIMAAGQAEALSKKLGERVWIVDKSGHARWSDIWANNPYIANASANSNRRGRVIRDLAKVVSGPGKRPYYTHFSRKDGMKFSDWKAKNEPGHMFLTLEELAYGRDIKNKIGPYVVVEPNLNKLSNKNKQWGEDRWKSLVKRLSDYTVIQLSQEGGVLPGVKMCITAPSFRLACSILNEASMLILPEGGLHHAAAALNKKAVVIFGGHTPPENLGYDIHVNLYSKIDKSPCGQWEECQHCVECMDMISVDDVEREFLYVMDRDA